MKPEIGAYYEYQGKRGGFYYVLGVPVWTGRDKEWETVVVYSNGYGGLFCRPVAQFNEEFKKVRERPEMFNR